MTGVAAIAICAAFTGCSSNDELYNPDVVKGNEAASIVEKYNQAFLKYVGGSIAPNQTWGFGGYSAGTRGVNADANEWAASDGEKWMVPPQLTTDQKNIVRIYFQNVYKPEYDDPKWTNYFIQQVYTGGSNPGTNSLEKYMSADGQTYITGSENMNHLAAINGDFVDHNYNFNHGGYPNPYPNVLDYTKEVQYTKNDNADHHHPDEIELMVSSTTESFGYFNSTGSVCRTEFTGLVSWSTIKDWADKNGHAGEADCLEDGWNRSFMGFDYELMIEDEMFATGDNAYATYAGPATEGRIWDGTNVINTISGYDQTTWAPIFAEGYEHMMYNDAPVQCLTSEQNMYAGDFINYTRDEDIIIEIDGYGKCLNMKKINDELLSQGYLPVAGGQLKKWVKLGGTADGYFSDWIVTLTEAKKYTVTEPDPDPDPDPDDVCIIAEDLSAADDTDFDFNDVVFTVHYTSETTAIVTLYAAGGTLPLTVAGREVHDQFGYGQPDPVTGLYKMINTGAKADVNDVATVSFEVSGIRKSNRGNDITIKANKGKKNEQGVFEDNWIELTATGGSPAAKLCVGVDFATGHKWCAERESIKVKHPVFTAWVTSNPAQIWWK